MKTYSKAELDIILEDHRKWLNREGGTKANLSRANLSGVNLSGVNLYRVNLSKADLYGCIGNMLEVKSMQIETYYIAYTDSVLQIGCENHLIEEWKEFDNETIHNMDENYAIDFWKKYKDYIFQTIELSPAEPTGH